MRSDPAERAALRIVRETDSGLVIRGKIGMHTSPAYAEDIYIGGLCGVDYQGHRATFIVPVNAPGIRVICRRIATRDANPFVSPLSSRYDELDGQMWLDDVHVPWERVFLVNASPELIARWLFWHQLYCWLSKAEVTLGLALACTHAMGLMSDTATNGYLLDLITDVQTVRSCLVAAERDPQFTAAGYCYPNICHLSAGSIAMLKARPGMSEMLRILPGSSLVVAPTDRDLAAPGLAAGFEESFGGGGYTALQRSALLQMAWDHVSSALDGTRVGIRAACQWRHSAVAGAAAARLQQLQRTRERRAAPIGRGNAGDRPEPACAPRRRCLGGRWIWEERDERTVAEDA